MATSAARRDRSRRERLRGAGFRPGKIWHPDTRLPAFAGDCRRFGRP
ncbi:antitoxin MazE-like protein [Methylobacterium sp. MA0201]